MADARDAGGTDLREAALRFSVDISGVENVVPIKTRRGK